MPCTDITVIERGNNATGLQTRHTYNNVRTAGHGPPAEDWDRLRPIIRSLYIDEKRILKDVIEVMTAKYNHKATTKMYKTRMKQWGDFDKHNRSSDMHFVLRKKRERDVIGKKSAFMVRNKKVTAREIARYSARKMYSGSILQEQVPDASTPDHIVCFTPSTTSDAENDNENAREEPIKDVVPIARSAHLKPLKRRKLNTFDHVSSSIDMAQCRRYHPVRAVLYTSIPLILAPPDTLLKHETLFANISSYFKGSIEGKIWFLSARGRYDSVYGNTIEPLDFLILCELAVSNFKKGSNVDGRRLLSKLCSILPRMLREQNLRLLEVIIDTYLELAQQGFVGISAMLQDYVRKLAQSVLCDRPVWQQICISISTPDPESSEIMTRSWQCILDMTKRTTGPFSFESIRSEINLIWQTHRTDSPHQESLLRELLIKYENGTNTLNDVGVYMATYCVDSLLDQGKYSEAETLLGGSLQRAQRCRCLTKMREARSLATLAQIQYLQHKHEPAEENVRLAINLYRQEYEMDGTVVIFYNLLEGWLREWGRYGEADELSGKLEDFGREDDVSVSLLLTQ
ncbi:hypothetical protein MMC32_004272 [Xylographa parallela]|nr:hypothetical protein [Xylographa parallela]